VPIICFNKSLIIVHFYLRKLSLPIRLVTYIVIRYETRGLTKKNSKIHNEYKRKLSSCYMLCIRLIKDVFARNSAWPYSGVRKVSPQ